MTPQMMKNINGWHNNFWGWGGEDVEMLWRILKGYKYEKIIDVEKNISLFDMMPHVSQKEQFNKPNPKRKKHVLWWKQWRTQGLSNLKYEKKETRYCQLFTHVLVDLFAPKNYS